MPYIFLYFGKQGLSTQAEKDKKIHPKKMSYTSGNGNPEKVSYIFGNRNLEKIIYISGNGSFLYFRKLSSLDKYLSDISGGISTLKVKRTHS